MKPFLYSILVATAVALTGCGSFCNNQATATMSPTPAPAASASAPAPAPAKVAVNLTGQWTWTCCDGKYSGTMTLQQDGEKLTGRLFDENDTTGGSVDGTVNGTTVKFNRKWGDDFSQDYTLTATADGSKVEGDLDGTKDDAAGTHFTAMKK